MSEPTPPQDTTQELTRKSSELDVLKQVSSDINSTLDLDEIYERALNAMSQLFGFHHAIILLLEEDGETLTVVASRGYENQAVGGQVKVGTGVIGVAAKKRRLMRVDHLGQYRSYMSAQRREMIKAGRGAELGAPVPVPGLPNAESQIALPLLVRDTLIGVFSIESPVRRTFDDRALALVTIVANQIASAIHNARLFAAVRQNNEVLEERVRARTSELERELRVARELIDEARSRVEGPLLGTSAAVNALRAEIARRAGAMEPVLLVGAQGSGREAIARAIHHESKRGGAFIHVQGPGADLSRLPLAADGTLYVDAVHDVPADVQAQLAAFLDSMHEARARGTKPDLDVRLIASTGRDLAEEVSLGRVNPVLGRALLANQIAVPPLAARREDISAMVESFLQKLSVQLGKKIDRVSPSSMTRLLGYGWPGNVRELRSVIERASLRTRGPILEVDEDLLDGLAAVGSYRLVQRLGSGGMGEVWLGKHQLLARPAAIKLIRSELSAGPQHDRLVQRFRREAQVTANLRSSHTVELYDFGTNDNGSFYYVMEYLPGMDLKDMVDRFGPLPPERVVMLLAQACLSLSEAHEHGLVHRDIKPANLFITRLGPEYDYLKVLDFGLVQGEAGDESTHLTVQGFVHGTPAFMSPERSLEQEVDGRSDLYSLGCVAFWLLTGRPVFESSNSSATLLAHAQTPPRPPSAVAKNRIPKELDAVVLHCLEKSPSKRPVSAFDLWEDLQGVPLKTPWTQHRARQWWLDNAPERLVAATK